ncbi:MAG TPA: hypothetical protein VIE65_02230 [Methylobacter sp.]|jgi:hypothetical protein
MTDERGLTWLALPEQLLTALLNFKKILTPDFFALSEAIWEVVGTVCLSLFVGLLFVVGLFVSVEIDSLRLSFGTVALAVVLLVLHAINRRLFRMLDEFVLGNQLVLTDYTLTDTFAAFSVLAAFFGVPFGIYWFVNSWEPMAIYGGSTFILVLIYIASYFLNPQILNIRTSKEASIGENGISYLSIFNGIGPARLMRLAYGIVMLNGFLMVAHGFFERLLISGFHVTDAFSVYDISAGDLMGTGAAVILVDVALPLPLCLYIIVIHVFLDALSSLVRAKNTEVAGISVEAENDPLFPR